ncbi:MAG: DUF7487 domain-containing protein [Nitrosopumilaceae archaeon]
MHDEEIKESLQSGDIIPPNCKVCGKHVMGWNRNKKTFCVCCSRACSGKNPDRLRMIKQTNLERYGVEHPLQANEIREKYKQTMIDKYGVENPLQGESAKEKRIQTNLERYGVEYPLQNKKIYEKTKQALLKRYGVEHPSYLESAKEKRIQTNLERYGHTNFLASNCGKEKIKQTNLERYGVEHVYQSKKAYEKIKEKIKQTSLERYGVGNFNQKHLSVFCLKKLNDPAWLKEQHHNLKKPLLQIAFELGVGVPCIATYFKKHSLKIKLYSFSHKAIQWLESIMKQEGIFIQHGQNIGEYKISGTRYSADGYCEETNTIYEFYGDFFHGNPDTYESDYYNQKMYITAGELYQKTLEREQHIRLLGYKLETKWENYNEKQ